MYNQGENKVCWINSSYSLTDTEGNSKVIHSLRKNSNPRSYYRFSNTLQWNGLGHEDQSEEAHHLLLTQRRFSLLLLNAMFFPSFTQSIIKRHRKEKSWSIFWFHNCERTRSVFTSDSKSSSSPSLILVFSRETPLPKQQNLRHIVVLQRACLQSWDVKKMLEICSAFLRTHLQDPIYVAFLKKQFVDGKSKPRTHGDWNRRNIAINRTELKFSPFEHKHVKKEMPTE